MIKPGALKGFLFSFLLILSGGFIFIGGAVSTVGTTDKGLGAIIALIGLALIALGLFIGLVACGA